MAADASLRNIKKRRALVIGGSMSGLMAGLTLRRDLICEAQEDLATDVGRELGRIPGQEEPGGPALPGDEDDVVGAKHLARSIAEVLDGYDFACDHLSLPSAA